MRRLFFQMIETNYVPIYMKIYSLLLKANYLSWTISKTIIFYFIVHCILCVMSISQHNVYALVSYATCEWPEMYSFK